MQILVNGILYETTEETKDQYVIRYFASKIVKYMEKIAKEFKDYRAFNNDWNRLGANYEYNQDGNKENLDLANKKALEDLDKNANKLVKRRKDDVTTSTSHGPGSSEPEMKLGHFSVKRFEQFLKTVNTDGDAKLPMLLGKDSDNDPKLSIPMLKIVNEKNFKSLEGLVSSNGQDTTNLENAQDAVRFASNYERDGVYRDRATARYFYEKLMKAKGIEDNSERYPTDEKMYSFFKSYINKSKISEYIQLVKKLTIVAVVGQPCGYGQLCIKNEGSRGSYDVQYADIKIPFFQRSNVDFPTFDEKVIMLKIANFKRDDLYSTLIHELTHAYEHILDPSLFYKSEDEGKSYRNKSYEVSAFSASLAEKLETSIRREIIQLRDYRKTINNSMSGYSNYVKKNNFIYNMFKDFDSFLNTFVNNVNERGDTIIDFVDNNATTLRAIKDNPDYKEVMGEKIKPWYVDLKQRYGNVIPSKELPLKKPKQSLDEAKFKGTCDRFRKTKVGEDEWQEMMSTATRINQRNFMKNVEIEDALDEDETWKEFLHVHRDVKFFESPKYYFMQTHGFEYIWAKEIEEEDIIK